MPLYDYRCSAGHVFEVIESYFLATRRPCHKCKRVATRVFPSPLVLTSDRRSANLAHDPVTGKDMSKAEINHWKNQPWPSTSDTAKRQGKVGKR